MSKHDAHFCNNPTKVQIFHIFKDRYVRESVS